MAIENQCRIYYTIKPCRIAITWEIFLLYFPRNFRQFHHKPLPGAAEQADHNLLFFGRHNTTRLPVENPWLSPQCTGLYTTLCLPKAPFSEASRKKLYVFHRGRSDLPTGAKNGMPGIPFCFFLQSGLADEFLSAFGAADADLPPALRHADGLLAVGTMEIAISAIP